MFGVQGYYAKRLWTVSVVLKSPATLPLSPSKESGYKRLLLIGIHCAMTASGPAKVVVNVLLYHAANRLDGGSQVSCLARYVRT
jgi:hypothetical protein